MKSSTRWAREGRPSEAKERIKAKWGKLHIASERLGLIGVVDEVVETEKGLAVVEMKRAKGPKKPSAGHVYQAAAYAMLAEEVIGRPVKRAIKGTP